MMPMTFIPSEEIPATAAAKHELLRARMAMMGELEASLQSSTEAILRLDLAGIEQRTREQAGLVREFAALLQAAGWPPSSEKKLTKDENRALPACAPVAEDELRKSRNRIVTAARLQSALLARAQRKLRVLANMLAGPGVTYGPFAAEWAAHD
jgi:hypothetical protein